jgi:protein gp37
MNATRIEYLDFTWSPLIGCSGEGCAVYAKCWARYQAKRRLHECQLCYDFKPHIHFERLDQPLKTKSSKRIGVCFSADFWDIGFSAVEQLPVYETCRATEWHHFINLTKQPQNIPGYFGFPDNWIQGVSVNRREDLWRIKSLQETRAEHKIISFEPLYESLGKLDLTGIDWVIVGAQTHPLVMPFPLWIDQTDFTCCLYRNSTSNKA